jgi:hypothetical protein
VRTRTQLVIVLLATLLAACSRDRPPPIHLADIGGASGTPFKGALYLYVPGSSALWRYVPGSRLDDYMTLEVNANANPERIMLLSIARCSWVGARFFDKGVAIVIFRGSLHLRSPGTRGGAAHVPAIEIYARNFDREPTDVEIAQYRSDGYTMVECKL